MSFLLKVLITSLLVCAKTSFAEVVENGDSYVVSEVVVTSTIENGRDAERELVAKAKISAFFYIQMYLGSKQKIDPNNVDVDSFLLEFTIKSIKSGEEGKVGEFVLVFDKAAMDSFLITEARKRSMFEEASVAPLFIRIDTTKNTYPWSNAKKMLSSFDVKYKILSIERDFVEIAVFGFNGLNDFKALVLPRGFQVIQNNNFLFLKQITIYDEK